MSHLIFIAGQKGGTTKTTTAHLMSLGAILRGQPAAYVLTDPHRVLKSEGRPYGVMDGRDGNELAKIITASKSTKNGWLIIDGGGNRPELDKAISEEADLTILPFRGSEEDLETISRDLAAMPNAVALPSAWPTNKHAQEAAQKFIDVLEQVYPGRVIKTPIFFVNSALELLGQRLDSPSTPVRNAARRAFTILNDRLQMNMNEQKNQ